MTVSIVSRRQPPVHFAASKVLNEAQKVLNQAKFDVATSMIEVKNVERKSEKTFTNIDQNILFLNKNIANLKKDSEHSLTILDTQISYLNERNEITKIADNAISGGSPKLLKRREDLLVKYGNPPKVLKHPNNYFYLHSAVLTEIYRVKLFYSNSTRVKDVDLTSAIPFLGQKLSRASGH